MVMLGRTALIAALGVIFALVIVLTILGARDRIPGLIQDLDHPDRGVRQAAAASLGKSGDSRAIQPLVAALPSVNAGLALERIGEPAVEPLIAALDDPDHRVREAAARVLGRIGDPRAIDPLIRTLKDAEQDVHMSAVVALGRIGESAVEPLLVALTDSDQRVRARAPPALAAIRNTSVRRRAVYGLGVTQDPRVTGALISALNDSDEVVRRNAVAAIGAIQDPQAVAPLITSLNDPDNESWEAVARALASIGGPATEPLIRTLKEGDLLARHAAAFALRQIGPPAVDDLITVLKDPDNGVRRSAAAALAEINDPKAQNALLLSLHEENILVIAGAHRFFIRHGAPGSENTLIRALAVDGNRPMAEAFLNCGNPQLVEAAKNWARTRGYQIYQTPGRRAGPYWGTRR